MPTIIRLLVFVRICFSVNTSHALSISIDDIWLGMTEYASALYLISFKDK